MPALTVEVKEKKDRGIGLSTDERNIVLTEQIEYICITNDRHADELAVITAAGLPKVGITMNARGAVCQSKRGRRMANNAYVWIVSTEWSSGKVTQEKDPGNPTGGPTTWFPVWSGSVETMDLPSSVDASGKPVLNSAKMPFSEPFMLSYPIAVSKFTQFEDPSTTLITILGRNAKVNDADFTTTKFGTFKKYCLLLTVDGYEYGWFGEEQCWKVDYTCKFLDLPVPATGGTYKYNGSVVTSPEKIGWREPVIDHGNYQLSELPCVDQQGRPIDAKLSDGYQIAPSWDPDILLKDRYSLISFNFIRKAA